MNSQRLIAFPPRESPSVAARDSVQGRLNIGTALTGVKSRYYSTEQGHL